MTGKSLLVLAIVGFAVVGITASPAAPISPIAVSPALNSAHPAQLTCPPAAGSRCYFVRKFRGKRGAYGYGPSYGYGYGPTFGFATTW